MTIDSIPLSAKWSQKSLLSKHGPYTLRRESNLYIAITFPNSEIPPQVKNGFKKKIFGSQVINKTPKEPRQFTAQETQEGWKVYIKSLALCSWTRINCKKTISGWTQFNKQRNKATFRVPPIPLIFKDRRIIMLNQPFINLFNKFKPYNKFKSLC